jgi:8-oxo-dGTP pyrophosphatase MutT (NUDIX family)
MNKQSFLNRFMLQQPSLPASKAAHLQGNAEINQPPRSLKKAAILMPLVERENGLQMIFTQRALHLKHHAGQVSFPGGKHELTDKNLAKTALRETEEEIGIKQKHIELIGHLPSITTGTGYHITPFIGFIAPEHEVIIDHGEVKVCFEVPFSFVLNKANFSKQHLMANKKRHFTYCCAYKGHLIWGATAQMLINLQHHLR